MREIQLTQGQVALVDDEDYEMLMNFKWQASKNIWGTYYVTTSAPKELGGGSVQMHRLIMVPDEYTEIDHIDGNPLNNQKANLRFCNHRQNGQNRHQKKTSRYPGVDWYKTLNKWRANIRINGKKVYLGLFEDEDEAYQAYKDACDAL